LSFLFSLQTRRQRGAALLIVMIVLAMLATLAAKNRRALSNLNEELQRIEADQLERLDPNATGD